MKICFPFLIFLFFVDILSFLEVKYGVANKFSSAEISKAREREEREENEEKKMAKYFLLHFVGSVD